MYYSYRENSFPEHSVKNRMLILEFILKLHNLQDMKFNTIIFNHNLFNIMRFRFRLMQEGIKSNMAKHLVFYHNIT